MSQQRLIPRFIEEYKYRWIEQSYGGKFSLDGRSLEGLSKAAIPAIGTYFVYQCVGVYIQLNQRECFCAHLQCDPCIGTLAPDRRDNDESVSGRTTPTKTPNYDKVVAHVHDQLQRHLGSCDSAYRETLVVCSGLPDLGSEAERDGIFAWAGITDREEQSRHWYPGCTGFIVTRPGVNEEILLFSDKATIARVGSIRRDLEQQCLLYAPMKRYDPSTNMRRAYGEQMWKWDISAEPSPASATAAQGVGGQHGQVEQTPSDTGASYGGESDGDEEHQ